MVGCQAAAHGVLHVGQGVLATEEARGFRQLSEVKYPDRWLQVAMNKPAMHKTLSPSKAPLAASKVQADRGRARSLEIPAMMILERIWYNSRSTGARNHALTSSMYCTYSQMKQNTRMTRRTIRDNDVEAVILNE